MACRTREYRRLIKSLDAQFLSADAFRRGRIARIVGELRTRCYGTCCRNEQAKIMEALK